jgi:release factor glutamine methyltransferase
VTSRPGRPPGSTGERRPSIGAALKSSSRLLAAAGLSRPRHEAEILLAHLLGLPRAALLAHPEREFAAGAETRLAALCRRRAAGEPSAYLTGVKEFWSLEFLVDSRVLIPRPETEHLVEEALRLLSEPNARIADFGTGSGCVALALAHERTGAELIGIDSSPAALDVARLNARRLGLEERFHPVAARSLAVLGPDRCLDGIVSNPPYIPLAAVADLSRDVREHEPLEALSPGPDGLETTRALVMEAARLLATGGFLAVEIDSPSHEEAQGLLTGREWEAVRVVPDLAGHPRVVTAVRR